MVAKLAFVFVLIVLAIAVATVAMYRYFDNQAERQHEKDLQQMEHTERMVEVAERESGIGGELERDRRP